MMIKMHPPNEPEPHICVGRSRQMRMVFDLLQKVKDVDVPVLLTGETGTGKELLARMIHSEGIRKTGPFVPVNCAAIPDTLLESEMFGSATGVATGVRQRAGKFEAATEGTLFLDEIADLSQEAQSKLLRALQDHTIYRLGSNQPIETDIRLISATNKNLPDQLDAGTFRLDLFFRIQVISIRVPALRERKPDIPLLMRHFLELFSRRFNRPVLHIPEATLDSYLAHPWSGNVRELRNVIQNELILSETGVLPPLNPAERPLELLREEWKGNLTEEEVKRDYARRVYEMVDRKMGRACEILAIDYKTLQKRLKNPADTATKRSSRSRRPRPNPTSRR